MKHHLFYYSYHYCCVFVPTTSLVSVCLLKLISLLFYCLCSQAQINCLTKVFSHFWVHSSQCKQWIYICVFHLIAGFFWRVWNMQDHNPFHRSSTPSTLGKHCSYIYCLIKCKWKQERETCEWPVQCSHSAAALPVGEHIYEVFQGCQHRPFHVNTARLCSTAPGRQHMPSVLGRWSRLGLQKL